MTSYSSVAQSKQSSKFALGFFKKEGNIVIVLFII